jgi:iron complex outermembrane receptor protein
VKMKKLMFVVFLFSLAAFSGYATAEVFELGEIVVTANSDTISKITSIEELDKVEMQLNDAVTVADALDTMPGLSISRGTRNEAYINVRGFSQRYVPIFYDGIPWYIPYDGYVDPGEISTGNISKISLTKGAASTLYGANTMGGVINIVSLKPTEEFEGSMELNLSKDHYVGSLNLGSAVGKFYFMGNIAGVDIDHFDMSDDYTPPGDDSPEDGDKRENSDIKSLTTSLKIGFTPVDGQEYAIGFHRTKSEKGWPPNTDNGERPRFWRFPEWEKTTYFFMSDSKITDDLSVKFRLYHDEYYNVLDAYTDATYTNMRFKSTYDDHTDGGSVTFRSSHIDNNLLSFAFHIKDDVHKSQGDIGDEWEKYETRMLSYGIEDAVKIGDNTEMVVGVGYDIQKPTYANGGALRDDDDAWTGILGVTHNVTDATALHFSVAKKTRFPTQKELYSSYLDSSVPNPNLKKEQSVNYEIGIASDIPLESRASFALFYSDVTDLITETDIWADIGEGYDWYDYNDNIGEATLKGVEFGLNCAHFNKNDISLGYTYIDAKNELTGEPISETPEHQLTLTDKVTFTEKLSIFAKAKYAKGQMEDTRSYGWIELDDYLVFDLKGSYIYNEYFQFDLSIQNLLDENYSTSYGFPREGRNIIFGIKAKF